MYGRPILQHIHLSYDVIQGALAEWADRPEDPEDRKTIYVDSSEEDRAFFLHA